MPPTQEHRLEKISGSNQTHCRSFRHTTYKFTIVEPCGPNEENVIDCNGRVNQVRRSYYQDRIVHNFYQALAGRQYVSMSHVVPFYCIIFSFILHIFERSFSLFVVVVDFFLEVDIDNRDAHPVPRGNRMPRPAKCKMPQNWQNLRGGAGKS